MYPPGSTASSSSVRGRTWGGLRPSPGRAARWGRSCWSAPPQQQLGCRSLAMHPLLQLLPPPTRPQREGPRCLACPSPFRAPMRCSAAWTRRPRPRGPLHRTWLQRARCPPSCTPSCCSWPPAGLQGLQPSGPSSPRVSACTTASSACSTPATPACLTASHQAAKPQGSEPAAAGRPPAQAPAGRAAGCSRECPRACSCLDGRLCSAGSPAAPPSSWQGPVRLQTGPGSLPGLPRLLLVQS